MGKEAAVAEHKFGRRSALGLVFGAVLAACGSTRSPRSAVTAPATSANPGQGDTTTESALPTTQSAPAKLSSTTVSAAPPVTSAPVALGSNKNITHEILVDDAKGYNGSWSGPWTIDQSGTSGTITAGVRLDPDARSLSVDVTVNGDLFHDGQAIAPFTLTGAVDSYSYGDDGTFSIHQQTPVGAAVITSGAGLGSGQFRLHLTEIPGHPRVASLDAQGVANRAGVVPTTMTITYTDGSTATGNCRFSH